MIKIIGYSNFVKGFRMIGVRDIMVIKSGEESIVEKELEGNAALVVLDGRVFNKLKPYVKDKIITSKKPLFFILDPEQEEDESLRLMIKRALGVEIENI